MGPEHDWSRDQIKQSDWLTEFSQTSTNWHTCRVSSVMLKIFENSKNAFRNVQMSSNSGFEQETSMF